MPKRTDIKKILIIGSGPIIISQACEFDYSGTQACKALKEEGFEVVLINSNPATIMTDPKMADKTYIEPITAYFVEKIIERERPDAILPTLGGQTALNVCFSVAEKGVLEKYNVEMIGANAEVIKKAEDRILFKNAIEKIGLQVPRSGYAYNIEEAKKIAKELNFPLVIRPAFTLGGTGGGIVYNIEELVEMVSWGIELSLIGQVLIEESVIGWKEYELEVMRDKADNVIIICSIENFDPMGIHTGDSITVAPAQTLSDKEYQQMRDAAIAIIREIGVETGGSNIQFAVNPEDGKLVVIEMNPRVSRSSALASKATGFPIAKIAAKLAIGYTLDEIPNDITKKTPASFEPTIDYVVVKIPRWAFEKFPEIDKTLTTSMKSVGEVMAIGRTFKESLQKAIRSLEIGRFGFSFDGKDKQFNDLNFSTLCFAEKQKIVEEIENNLKIPNSNRLFYIKYAFQVGFSIEKIHNLTKIDKWFLSNLKEIVDIGNQIASLNFYNSSSSSSSVGNEVKDELTEDRKQILLEAKQAGFSDRQIAYQTKCSELEIRNLRKRANIVPSYKLVDTCAAEFEAYTPYYYSTYETENEAIRSKKRKVAILGGGPNRIGQGIEFDYCCVHASYALKEEGYESIMINSNPETVSTDYDTSDKLYFEPLTFEDVMNIIENEQPEGIIVQFGGQTPLNLAIPLSKAGVKILGTSADAIDLAEDRQRFKEIVNKLSLNQPDSGTVFTLEEAKKVASKIGYPILVRPSYVLGGRAMRIVYDDIELEQFMEEAVLITPEHPVLIDRFLQDAIEVDVDAISDGEITVIGGIMEHIEQAGIHSGDSAMVLPPYSLGNSIIDEISEITKKIATELNIKGLINIQFAVKDNKIFILEVNPRASRTVPFVSKAIGVPLANLATKIMIGRTLKELNFLKEINVKYTCVKESVFPFIRFSGCDPILGPEMKSTGEVMGIDFNFGSAYVKSQLAASQNLPTTGTAFISVNDKDKRYCLEIATKLIEMGFSIVATSGTANFLKTHNIDVSSVFKLHEGRPHVIDLMKNGNIKLIINTPGDKKTKIDEAKIRAFATSHLIPLITTISGAFAVIEGIKALKNNNLSLYSLQEYHQNVIKSA